MVRGDEAIREVLRVLVFALLATTFLIASEATAEPDANHASFPTGLSDMQTGRLLVRAGQLAHARAFLEQAAPETEDEHIERLFLLGRIEMRLGMPQKAAERFEEILAVRPGLTRVRLELARAYFMAGLNDKARHYFSSSLAEELPSTVEAAVEDFLRRIDARKRWSISISGAVLPETKRPVRESVLIGGVPFRLDKDTRAPSGTGALLSGGISYSPRINEHIRGVLAATTAAKLYARSSWNQVTATGEIGVARLFDRGSAAGGVRVGHVWTGGDPDHVSFGPWARIESRVSASTQVHVALSADRRRHRSTNARDGWRIAVTPRLVHAFDGRTSIEFEPVFAIISANSDHQGSRLVGLGTTLSHAFEGGLSVSFEDWGQRYRTRSREGCPFRSETSAQARRHAAPDPLFGKRRVDRMFRVGLRVAHRSLRYLGFAPYAGYSLEHYDSSIPVHEYRIQGFIAGASRTF